MQDDDIDHLDKPMVITLRREAAFGPCARPTPAAAGERRAGGSRAQAEAVLDTHFGAY
jgi:hypothetical protein